MVQPLEKNGRAAGFRQVFHHEFARLDPSGQGGLRRFRRASDHLAAASRQCIRRLEDVSRLGLLLEDVDQGGGHPLGRIFGQAHLPGDAIGGLEPDAVDILGQGVGIGAHPADGIGAVVAEDAPRQGQGDAVGLEEEHRRPGAGLLPPGLDQLADRLLADPFHLREPLGFVFEDGEGVGAEMVHDPLGHFFRQAGKGPGAEIAPDPVLGHRHERLPVGGSKLSAVARMALPGSPQAHPLSRFDAGQGAADGDGRLLLGHGDPRHDEVAVGTGEDDLFHFPGETIRTGFGFVGGRGVCGRKRWPGHRSRPSPARAPFPSRSGCWG